MTDTDSPDTGAAAAEPRSRRSLIELGWVLVGRFDPPDRTAIADAREAVLTTLAAEFPGFHWRMPVVERESTPTQGREEPVTLLDLGAVDRQAKSWDFALVVTGGDLRSFYKPFALATPSRSLAVAVVSTARIDPQSSGRGAGEGERAQVMTRRLRALVLHVFGHLNGLEHGVEPGDFMNDLSAVSDLDAMTAFSAEALDSLGGELAKVADERLEEERFGRRSGRTRFYLRASWRNRSAIASSVRQARPWEFPLRFSRLTTAAFSALLILMVTAEAWDLGMTQTTGFAAGMSLTALLGTCGYLLVRQQLLVRRSVTRLTELNVVTNVSIVISVVLGMLTTYAALFASVMLLARAFFKRRLVVEWAAALEGAVEPRHYLIFAAFVASLGLVIGALGASFEEQKYFRHVAYVDEET